MIYAPPPTIHNRMKTAFALLNRGFEDRLRKGPPTLGDPHLTRAVFEAAGPVPGRTVLDVGCGTGDLAARLTRAGARVCAVDVCRAGLDRASRRLHDRALTAFGDGESLPFRDGSFDLISSVLVLHYFRRPARAVREIRRILRPGGRLLLADRIAAESLALRRLHHRLERLRNAATHRLRSARGIEALLSAAGFRILTRSDHERSDTVERWLRGVGAARARRVEAELTRLGKADLGGLRLTGSGRIAFRMELYVCARE